MFSRLHYLRSISLSTISLCAAITNSSIAMQENTESVDIAIIGGGMAGLTAAYNLSNSGLSSCLFEAKDEVGGRAKTYHFNENQYYELGGTQIDSDHHSVIKLAEQLGVELDKVSYGEGKFSVCHKDQPLSDEGLINILEDAKKVFGEFKEYDQDRDLIFDSSEQSYKFHSIQVAIDKLSTEEARRFWETFIKEECGVEVGSLPITAANWLHEEASDYHKLLFARSTIGGSSALNFAAKMNMEGTYSYRVKGGMSNLVHTLRDRCQATNFVYNQALKSLSKDESGYHLVFGNKTVTAKKVIMTIPFSTLRDVEFGENFGLNKDHKDAIQNLPYATISKIGLPVTEEFSLTGEFGMLGHFNIDQHQQFHAWPGHNALTITVGGELGKNLSENEIESFQENVTKNLPPIYLKIGEFGKSHIKNWASDPFAKGSWSTSSRNTNYKANYPSISHPGLQVYAEPINQGTFIFAGEHAICGEGRSHIEGAVQSGEIAARIILDKNTTQNDEKEKCSIQ